MRKYLLLAAPLALAACSDDAAEAPMVEEEAMVEEDVAAMTTANGTLPGTHDVTGPDGIITAATLNPDGTHSTVDADDNVLEEGTWSVVDGKTCFTNSLDVDQEEPMCWEETAPGEDGSFTATNEDGVEITVRPTTM